ncbi:hypothetical protein [Streptomyces sp. NBC_01803]|uniref:hypothetical protein n=1 Tax=Streptomyces sp. NBC_01803 TaxID=2975946 RepID=UPI002DDC6DCC|nr:hypothetical protein [Streptomyces sp. NBC_01803]WSA43344.1 hypothetical protein OIE51_03520 [Streptomyces sp. NBC_01803]
MSEAAGVAPGAGALDTADVGARAARRQHLPVVDGGDEGAAVRQERPVAIAGAGPRSRGATRTVRSVAAHSSIRAN